MEFLINQLALLYGNLDVCSLIENKQTSVKNLKTFEVTLRFLDSNVILTKSPNKLQNDQGKVSLPASIAAAISGNYQKFLDKINFLGYTAEGEMFLWLDKRRLIKGNILLFSCYFGRIDVLNHMISKKIKVKSVEAVDVTDTRAKWSTNCMAALSVISDEMTLAVFELLSVRPDQKGKWIGIGFVLLEKNKVKSFSFLLEKGLIDFNERSNKGKSLLEMIDFYKMRQLAALYREFAQKEKEELDKTLEMSNSKKKKKKKKPTITDKAEAVKNEVLASKEEHIQLKIEEVNFTQTYKVEEVAVEVKESLVVEEVICNKASRDELYEKCLFLEKQLKKKIAENVEKDRKISELLAEKESLESLLNCSVLNYNSEENIECVLFLANCELDKKCQQINELHQKLTLI